jgi:4-amino-4-deoxy-L-arabinose transferase-like glycosyltransferase
VTVSAVDPGVRRSSGLSSSAIYLISSALLTALVLTACLTWALVSKPFSGPDEMVHYNSVTRVMNGGGWPRPYDARIENWTVTAVTEAGRTYLGQARGEPAPPGARSPMFDDTAWSKLGGDQMVQHPPLYYYGMAVASHVLLDDESTWDHAQLVMRALSSLVLAAAVPFLIGVGSQISGSRRAGLIGGSAVLLVPFFTNTGGFINNDALLVTICSASIYCAVRAWRGSRRTFLWIAAAGFALGLALLVKGLAVIFIFAIMAASRYSTWSKRLLLVAAPMLIAFVVGGWWWARNLLILGKLQPSILGDREHLDEPHENYDLWNFIATFILRFNRTFWGRGAREELAFPTLLVDIAGILLAILIVVTLTVVPQRGAVALLWLFPALIITTTLTNAHGIYWDLGTPNRGVQGRYIFAGAAALCVTVACFGRWAMSRRSERVKRVASAGFIIVASLVTSAGIAWVLARTWAGVDGALASAIAEAHGISPAWTLIVPATGALLALALAAAVAFSAVGGDIREPRARTEAPVAAGTS